MVYSFLLCAFVYRVLLVQESFLFNTTTEKGFTAILAFHFMLSRSYLKYFGYSVFHFIVTEVV